ncbi:tetratricopeptide repeat protein [Undibacterium flavidum]|uniref:Tetratricopeptide repeat protein n=1 Tax=Undibacterium flavidum TaxID=2762297 RepID=A0ABR6YA61_9BURK|nr:hypothetical protein [Undibacterium flavidum]MBC3873054.1 hypothetical protein [Undibacterium flavidum]
MQEKLAEAVQILDAQAMSYQDDAEYFNLVGVLQLKKKDYVAAANMFERAVLIDHDNAGAWMDLAIATFESGNTLSAQSYFEYIESKFQPPVAIRKLIDAYKRRIELKSVSPKPWQALVEFQLGHDSNANSGLQSTAIPITFGGETVNLPLDLSLKARADEFIQTGVAGSYRQLTDNSMIELGVAAKNRIYQREKAFSSAELSVNAGGQLWTTKGILATNLYLDHSQLSGQSLLNNVRLNASWDRQWKTCRYGVGNEFEMRRYLALQPLNANIVWVQLAGVCQTELLSREMQISMMTRYGIDNATGVRAGGDSRRKELMLQISVPISNKINSQLSANFSSTLDAKGYSSLLENNARRNLTRKSYGWQCSVLVYPTVNVLFKIEKNLIQSNLPLFNQSGQLVNLGLKIGF